MVKTSIGVSNPDKPKHTKIAIVQLQSPRLLHKGSVGLLSMLGLNSKEDKNKSLTLKPWIGIRHPFSILCFNSRAS